MVDSKYDVELVVEGIELVECLLYKCEKCLVELVDKSLVEMDEMLLMYLEKVIDVLNDRVELMGIKLDEKNGEDFI